MMKPAAFLACALLSAAALQQEPTSDTGARDAVPIDPVTGILEAGRSHQIVALGEPHGNKQGQAVRLALVRDARFPGVFDDIVVEFGNARYQAQMDRFIRGEQVPEAELRQAWQNTTQHAVWDSPIYREFFQTVRDVNRVLPPARQIRVLLGDPPIDWASVKGPRDHWNWMLQRDSFPAELIQREVIQKGRRALVIYGDSHLQRRPIETNYSESSDPRFNTLASFLDRQLPRPSLFIILVPTGIDVATIQPSVASWHAPQFATTRGNVLGHADFVRYFSSPPDRRTVREGKLEAITAEQWRPRAMEDQFDAILYLGPPAALETQGISTELCADPEYMQMRASRFEIVNAQRAFDSLREECASALRKK